MVDPDRIVHLFSVLHDSISTMQDKLDFYYKFLDSPSPRHRGIPFMAASEGFGSSPYDPYGRFKEAYKELVNALGLGHLWEKARERGGWVGQLGRAKRILYPDMPTFVPTPEQPKPPKVSHDPERAKKAAPYLSNAIELMIRDVQELEMTYSSDPSTFLPGLSSQADEFESLSESISLRKRRRLWEF